MKVSELIEDRVKADLVVAKQKMKAKNNNPRGSKRKFGKKWELDDANAVRKPNLNPTFKSLV